MLMVCSLGELWRTTGLNRACPALAVTRDALFERSLDSSRLPPLLADNLADLVKVIAHTEPPYFCYYREKRLQNQWTVCTTRRWIEKSRVVWLELFDGGFDFVTRIVRCYHRPRKLLPALQPRSHKHLHFQLPPVGCPPLFYLIIRIVSKQNIVLLLVAPPFLISIRFTSRRS